jgi:hypothetical protein
VILRAAATLATDPLAPIRTTLASMAAHPRQPALTGLVPGLIVADPTGWVRASELTSGAALPDLLDAARQRWNGTAHASAALAWKCYTFWLALPAVVGYASARRVPLVRPDAVVLRWSARAPFVVVGLLPAIEVAVLPSDPLALTPGAGVRVVDDEPALLSALRTSLVDEHLAAALTQLRGRVHLGRRTLWGSLASGIAHGLSRSADVLPGPAIEVARPMLGALDLDDLVDVGPHPDGRPGLAIQRRTCCLAFTLPEPTICTGCCIR